LRQIHPDPPDFSESRAIYHWQNGRWSGVPAVAGGSDLMAVSSGGAIWAMPASQKGMDRWDGRRWTHYRPTDYGSVKDYVPGGFAIHGDDVWVTASDGVARWNGRGWHFYPEAVKTGHVASIAAGASGVWAIDDTLNLSHFDGEQWTIEDLRSTAAGAEWHPGVDDNLPELHETADGALWLLLVDRMWRNGGDGWREIRREDVYWQGSLILGHDGGNLWVRGYRSIFELKPDGSVGRVFDRRDLPVNTRADIVNLAAADGKIWLATAKGLLEYDGGRWQQCGMPAGATVLNRVAVAADGSVWSVAESRSLLRIAMWVAPPLGAAAITLLVIGTLLVMWVKRQAEERLAADEAVVQAAGNVPGMDMDMRRAEVKTHARGLFWKVPLFLIGFPYLVVSIRWGRQYLQRVWPNAPESVTWACVLSPLAAALGFWFWRWTRKRSQSGRLFGTELRVTLGAAIYVWIIGHLPVPADSFFTGPVFLFLAILVFFFLLQARNILAVYLTQKLWLAGEYDRALQRLRWISLGHPTATMLQTEGVIYSVAGRYAEGEACMRKALAKSGNAGKEFRARLLCTLGFTLQDAGRPDDAQPCFQTAIALGDKTGSARIGLANILLEQGKDPENALALIETAQRIKQNRLVTPERFADKAWALALMGRQQEMEQAAAVAVKGINPDLKALAAGVHWKLGRAFAAAQRATEAIDHFRAALQADPSGSNGMLARTELEQRGIVC
jgi:tetratricopeptide (TPR) repeat protein